MNFNKVILSSLFACASVVAVDEVQLEQAKQVEEVEIVLPKIKIDKKERFLDSVKVACDDFEAEILDVFEVEAKENSGPSKIFLDKFTSAINAIAGKEVTVSEVIEAISSSVDAKYMILFDVEEDLAVLPDDIATKLSKNVLLVMNTQHFERVFNLIANVIILLVQDYPEAVLFVVESKQAELDCHLAGNSKEAVEKRDAIIKDLTLEYAKNNSVNGSK